MPLISVCFLLRTVQQCVWVLVLAVAVGVYFIPSPIDPEPFIFEGPPPALEGPLAVNTRLQRGRRLFAGQLKGPESFTADQNGNVYTGTVDGKLWRINNETLTFITQMGQNLPECGTSTDYEPVCGRPHGLRLDRHGQLIVADSYFGLFKVDPWTGQKTLLHSSKEGFVRTLLDSLYMPNGFAFSADEDFLVLAETSIGHISRFWLKGHKAGTKETAMNNMVGYPDNIRISDHGTFLVGINTVRFRGRLLPPFLDLLAPYPALKCFVVIPLGWYDALLPSYGLVLELGPDRQLLDSLHDPTGTLTWAISDVFQQRGIYYLGNTDLPFLAVLDQWS
uniref:Zgc:194209 n=1 Tax=Astyanax mexicanus TaxID=7994 RepID=A0A3B1JSJ4_ASTMX